MEAVGGAEGIEGQQQRPVLLQQLHQGLAQRRHPGRLGDAAHPAIGQQLGQAWRGSHRNQLQVPGRGGQAPLDAGDQLGLLRCAPAVAAVEHQQQRLATGQQGRECIVLDAGEVAIEHQQHQVGAQGHPGGQPGPGCSGDLIDAGGVHQLHPLQALNRLIPGPGGLVAGAAMGHVGGEGRLPQQGVEQARLAHPHPAEHGHPQAALAQALQLAIEGLALAGQLALFAAAELQLAAPLVQELLAALRGGGHRSFASGGPHGRAPSAAGWGRRHQPASTASTASAPITPTKPPNSSTTTRTPVLLRRKPVSSRSARIISGT